MNHVPQVVTYGDTIDIVEHSETSQPRFALVVGLTPQQARELGTLLIQMADALSPVCPMIDNPEKLKAEVLAAFDGGDCQRIRAVKRYRELTGASLKLAIDYVDSLKGANHG